jgi:hypothetical protein
MKRYYYLSNSINDTDRIHQNLIKQGITADHIHVYGVDDKVAQAHDFNAVLSIFKTDMVHYILRGLLIGLSLTIIASLGLTYFVDDVVSILPFMVLFGALFTGFVSWEAGLIGLHKLNYKFVPLIKMLGKSKHLVLIDVTPAQFPFLVATLKEFKNIEAVAVGSNFVNPFEDQETLLPRH